ncbi:MAG TPA: zf-HC2 domain-containing protein [Candidatus Dormibacteraeota bacterium]|nr:zf-HC2 domain-containing protein [Candidatus Dormibacteraeota bacterium]
MAQRPTPTLACARVRVLMESYVDGELALTDPQTADQVRSHLLTCEDCRRQHDQAASLPFRLKALRSPLPPASITRNVMAAIRPASTAPRRAWTLLIPEGLLLAFIVWYVSGVDGLASAATGTLADLQVLMNWTAGAAELPKVPVADVFLLIALIALAVTAAYHLAVLARLDDGAHENTRLRERRRA